MFEGLKGKAEEALQRQRDEETKKQSEHDVNMMSVKQAIALAENNVDDAKKERARLSEEMAKAKDELGEVEASKAADEKSLEETQHECQSRAVEWENRQKEGFAQAQGCRCRGCGRVATPVKASRWPPRSLTLKM